jgi:hypothetical protein
MKHLDLEYWNYKAWHESAIAIAAEACASAYSRYLNTMQLFEEMNKYPYWRELYDEGFTDNEAAAQFERDLQEWYLEEYLD